MKHNKRTASKITIFLFIFVILTALHWAVLAYLYNKQYDKNIALILKSQENMIELEQTRARAELRDVFQDLYYLEGVAESIVQENSFSDDFVFESTKFNSFFNLLGVLTLRYESISLISPQGDELYKLSFDDGGNTSITVRDDLKKGGEDYYFQKLNSDSRSLYISRIKLAEKDGVITEPLSPKIRIGRGVEDKDGEIRAYLILNYKAGPLLDHIGDFEILPDETFNTYLFNNEGYFISSPGNYLTFSFQYPEKKNQTLSKILPDVWLRLQMNPGGTFSLDNNLYVHRRIEVQSLISKDSKYLTDNNLNERFLFLVYETPDTVLKSLSKEVLLSLLLPFLVTQIIILAVAVLGAKWISRLQRYEQKLLHFSSMDEMTGCMNRRTGRKILEKYLSLSRRRTSVLTVVYLDLNNLKSVNDKLGHREGDHYILTMVDLIKEQLRSSDFFIRMGGDEFLLILPDCCREEAIRIRKRVLVKEHKLNNAHIYPYSLGMSWGIIEVSSDQNITVTQILAEADKLMYEEKSNYPQVNDALIKEVEEQTLDIGENF